MGYNTALLEGEKSFTICCTTVSNQYHN